MNDGLTTLLRWLVRAALMLMGLVVVVGLLTASVLLVVIWGLRRIWVKVMGQPAPTAAWRYRRVVDWRAAYAAMGKSTSRAPFSDRSRKSGILPSAADEVTDVNPR